MKRRIVDICFIGVEASAAHRMAAFVQKIFNQQGKLPPKLLQTNAKCDKMKVSNRTGACMSEMM